MSTDEQPQAGELDAQRASPAGQEGAGQRLERGAASRRSQQVTPASSGGRDSGPSVPPDWLTGVCAHCAARER